jgi:predicted nucleic acid-binding protein
MRFADTNVLLYSISRAPEERGKAERASSLLADHDLSLSVQVLQEFYVQATRESRADPISHRDAMELVESFRRFRVAPLTADLISAAMTTCDRFQISYWDAAILEAARSLGCGVVLSEDLNDGQDYDGIRVENPFRPGR